MGKLVNLPKPYQSPFSQLAKALAWDNIKAIGPYNHR